MDEDIYLEEFDTKCKHGILENDCKTCEAEFEAWVVRTNALIDKLPWCTHTWPENPQGMYHCPDCGTMTLGEKHRAGQDMVY